MNYGLLSCPLISTKLRPYIQKRAGQSTTHTHNRHLCTQFCTLFLQANIHKPACKTWTQHAQIVQGAGTDEAVAAFGLRHMMDGKELMTVLGGCSLPFIFPLTPPHTVALSSYPPPIFRHIHLQVSPLSPGDEWWREDLSCLRSSFLPFRVSASPTSSTAADPVQFIEPLLDSWARGRRRRRHKRTCRERWWDRQRGRETVQEREKGNIRKPETAELMRPKTL